VFVFAFLASFSSLWAQDTDAGSKDLRTPKLPAAILNTPIDIVNGKSFLLDELNGKVVLIQLSAIWNHPGNSQIPMFIEMRKKYYVGDLEIIGLDIGNEELERTKAADIESFTFQMGINFPMASISEETVQEFAKLAKFNGVPIVVLLDRSGSIRGTFLGASPGVNNQIKEMVENLVSEPIVKPSTEID